MVVRLPHVVDPSTEESLREGAVEIVKEIKPQWNIADLRFKIYTDGITNKLIGVWRDSVGRADQVLIRVYGAKTELFIDREAEAKNIQIFHKAGCGPELYATFENGLSYAYIDGSPLGPDSVLDEEIWKEIIEEMVRMHNIQIEGTKDPTAFQLIDKFYALMPEKFDDLKKQDQFAASGYSKENLNKEIEDLKEHLKETKCPIVLCHNDLLLGNIIRNSNEKSIKFIDYEYASPNYQAYDIGNHFNEHAGVDTVDYSRYPSKEYQLKWIRCYLATYKGVSEDSLPESEVWQWYVWINKFSLVSHMSWGLWAFVQAYHSSIDFDFIEYAIIRLNEYHQRKQEFFSL
ncbi:ethanolamine kinase 2-like [Oratosquilla oratoria]|uniref:ethanolamine kinase 2-like n=1 Tax=Oratosquilla oratoria TaxID=337810 RepID=UPI003F75A6CA